MNPKLYDKVLIYAIWNGAIWAKSFYKSRNVHLFKICFLCVVYFAVKSCADGDFRNDFMYYGNFWFNIRLWVKSYNRVFAVGLINLFDFSILIVLC